MKTLIGGVIAAALGLIGIIVWWSQFLVVLAGTVPIVLLLGGALAIYLGFDEMKDSWGGEEVVGSESSAGEDVEKYKQEIDELKQELHSLKKEEKE